MDKNTHHAIIGVLVVVLVISLCVIGWLCASLDQANLEVLQVRQTLVIQQQMHIPVKQPDTASIPDQSQNISTTTEQLKTYWNNKYGFTFQYLGNLQLWDNLDSTESGTWRAVRLIYTVDQNNNFDVFDIETVPNPQNLSAVQFLDQQIQDGKNCDGPCGWFSKFESKNVIQAGDNTFYGVISAFTGEVPSADVYYVSQGNKIYQIKIANFDSAEAQFPEGVSASKEAYKILNTLRFTK